MSNTIYVELFDEGTPTYRRVPAAKIAENIYELGGQDFHDPDDEHWQFLPGSRVVVETRKLQGGNPDEGSVTKEGLVAVRALQGVANVGNDQGICGSEIVRFQQQRDQVTVVLRSGGYRRKRGSLFRLVFDHVTSFIEHDPIGRELYGIFELIQLGHNRQFRIMVSDVVPCLEITAEDILIQDVPQG